MKTLRDYQIDLAQQGYAKIKELGIVYYAVMMRVGKSAISLETCRLMGVNKVIFLTKKKAISSVKNDYKDFNFDKHFELIITNNENLHNITEIGRAHV